MTQTRQQQIQSSLGTVLVLNALAAVLKTAWGLSSRSSAMLADGLHSLSAAVGNLVGIVAAALVRGRSDAQADRVHHYEHRAAAVVGGIMVLLAAWIGWRAVGSLLAYVQGDHGATAHITTVSFIILAIAGTLSLGAAGFAWRRGKRLDSPALRSGARHSLSDVWSTVGVLVTSALTLLGLGWADAAMGLVIAGIIAWMAVGILRESLPGVRDRSAHR